MQNYSLLFYVKKTKNNPDLSAIYMRFTINGKRTELSTGQKIKTSSWNSKKGQVILNGSLSKSINIFLDTIRLKLFNCYTELLNLNKEITPETLKNRFLGVDIKTFKIVEVFENHNLEMKALIGKTFSKGTWCRYETSLRHTIEFMKWKYNVSNMDVREVNPAFISN